MVRWMVAVLACCAAGAARAEKPPTERQRMACRVYAEATKDLAPAVAKQRAAYAEAKIGDISYALPDAAEAAAKAAQKAQQDADGPLKILQEKVEDLNYQLRLCAR